MASLRLFRSVVMTPSIPDDRSPPADAVAASKSDSSARLRSEPAPKLSRHTACDATSVGSSERCIGPPPRRMNALASPIGLVQSFAASSGTGSHVVASTRPIASSFTMQLPGSVGFANSSRVENRWPLGDTHVRFTRSSAAGVRWLL